ncbi:MAG: RNA-binding transcriptional accessory protein [Clostridiales bacterium GWF2_38_85]|nr:MAG: RNA-binding transcriptional accessory protein [Clostridiales bacterium GWF2_38_85]HBL85218.1 RNA-binding transcriptional accessory protein [Clostridiales bacterium]
MEIKKVLTTEFKLKLEHVENIISLIDESNTIPFIARYRKEMTGSCDDQVLRELADRLEYLRNFEDRKQKIKDSITEQGKMTDEIAAVIDKAVTLSALEDIYRPFKPKRRTRATIAKEKGLEPFAVAILKQDKSFDVITSVQEYINAEVGVNSVEEVIDGAKDIISETISDDPNLRGFLRDLMKKEGLLTSKSDKTEIDESKVYEMYFEYSEAVSKIPSHRILAINRGEREDILKVSIELNDLLALNRIYLSYIKNDSSSAEYVKQAADDAWSRLIKPSIEREIRNDLTEFANSQAISMFAINLKPLLMQPPIKGKTVLGFDPAYRTGCKIAVVDPTGKALDTTVVYPTPPNNKIEESKTVLKKLIKKHDIEVISIGNGTASKESEIFVAGLIKELDTQVSYMVVNEAGASVYSASKLGASEFPEFDVSLRSAVSIARRLQDPLAELVKIDPKSIGVGQYQHDMPPAKLNTELKGVVESCVNNVGVDLNTASASLLSYISGLGASVATNITNWRNENGAFKTRTELKKVPKLGPKAFEQCAGFLRIPKGKNILDNTSVHPESYEAAKKLLELFGMELSDINTEKVGMLPSLVKLKGEAVVAEACSIGIPTLNDIINELLKPGRDIRDELPPPLLRSDIMSMEDLTPGMELTGTVRNVIDFGVFVDIAVHQDGLVHISEISDRYIKHPSEVVKVGDIVKVFVLSVDLTKKRIALSMKRKP